MSSLVDALNEERVEDFVLAEIENHPDLHKLSMNKYSQIAHLSPAALRSLQEIFHKVKTKFPETRNLNIKHLFNLWREMQLHYNSAQCPEKWRVKLQFLEKSGKKQRTMQEFKAENRKKKKAWKLAAKMAEEEEERKKMKMDPVEGCGKRSVIDSVACSAKQKPSKPLRTTVTDHKSTSTAPKTSNRKPKPTTSRQDSKLEASQPRTANHSPLEAKNEETGGTRSVIDSVKQKPTLRTTDPSTALKTSNDKRKPTTSRQETKNHSSFDVTHSLTANHSPLEAKNEDHPPELQSPSVSPPPDAIYDFAGYFHPFQNPNQLIYNPEDSTVRIYGCILPFP